MRVILGPGVEDVIRDSKKLAIHQTWRRMFISTVVRTQILASKRTSVSRVDLCGI
jgi:hypothetical protein